MTAISETVNLDSGLGDTLLDEECRDLLTLVSLELYNLAGLFVINESTVAREFLLEGFQEFLCIVLFGETLQSSQSLATVPLLDTDVDIILLRPYVLRGSKRASFVCEGIESGEVLHVHATGGKVNRKKLDGNEDLSGGCIR